MTGPAHLVIIQAGSDIRLLLRNGEQLLLTILIPLGLLIGLTLATSLPLAVAPGATRIETALAGVLAVAALSSAFTSLAIGIGFDRRSGALLMLATTPLTRTSILAARSLATLVIVAGQAVVLAVAALALGWRPTLGSLGGFAVLLLGAASLGALGFALGGAVRAEATLAIANAVFLILLVAGGTAWPTSSLPAPIAAVVSWLPSAALGDALRALLASGPSSVPFDVLLLIVWGGVGTVVAARTFRWR